MTLFSPLRQSIFRKESRCMEDRADSGSRCEEFPGFIQNGFPIKRLFVLLLLLLHPMACSDPESLQRTRITEYSKCFSYIERQYEEDYHRAVHLISLCGDQDSVLLSLKDTLQRLYENTANQLAQVYQLQNKAELKTFKHKLTHQRHPVLSGQTLAAVDNFRQLDLEAFSIEEGKMIFKINLLLAETALKDKVLSRWAIDCQ